MAKYFMDNVFKIYGFPTTIVSDRDPIFLSQFWQNIFNKQKVDLHYSITYHPKSDGKTVVNKCLENYLRCMTDEHPTSGLVDSHQKNGDITLIFIQ